MSTDRELKAFDETETDALLEAAAKYELLNEQFKNGNNVERASAELLGGISTVFRRCHKTIRELRNTRPHLPEGGVKCGNCGGSQVMVRGKFPGNPDRPVCPCCTIEALEDLTAQQNTGADSTLPPQETRKDSDHA